MVMMLFMMLLLTTYLGLFLFLHRFIVPIQSNIEVDTVSDSIAVVIAMRNEEDQIVNCLESLNQSLCIENSLHVYLIDDHSIDASIEKVNQHKPHFDRMSLTLINASEIGKKKALIEALSKVTEAWCFLTDADCEVQPHTIASLIQKAKAEKKGIAYGPVLYNMTSFPSALMAYENLNTQFVGESLLNYGKPAMVNGANTLLSESAIPAFVNAQNLKYASGDDVFFSQTLGRDGYAVSYDLKSAVKTDSPESIVALLNQRLRWASKFSAYTAGFYKFFPAFVFLQNVSFLILLTYWVALGFGFNAVFVVLICKWLIEWSFHAMWFRKYNFQATLLQSVLLSFLQPIHVSCVGILSLLNLSFHWKGRNVVNRSIVN